MNDDELNERVVRVTERLKKSKQRLDEELSQERISNADYYRQLLQEINDIRESLGMNPISYAVE